MKRERVPGSVRVRGVARGVPYPKEQGWTNIPAWSRGAAPWDALSPFNVGPVQHTDEYGCAHNTRTFETWWQSFKVWDAVDGKKHTEGGADQLPSPMWYKWHQQLLEVKDPVRRPNGKEIPLYAWWNKQKLGVVEARKQIYIPKLQEHYRRMRQYRQLLDMVRDGTNVIILEPDGPPPELFPGGMDVTVDTLVRMQDATERKDIPGCETDSNKYVPYGHGYVIALCLLEDIASE